MLSIYYFCLIVGGIFIALSALAGVDGIEFDHHFDCDLEINEFRRFWLPFFNLKFWTFGIGFFGLTGVLLSNIQPALLPNTITIISVISGLFCGTVISLIMRSLSYRQVNSLVRSHDLVGIIGIVEIPFDQDSKGKVKLTVKNSDLYLIAYTQENREFHKDEKVLVVGMENNKLWVVSSDQMAQLPE
ncbi:MAG: NfeD family protein [Microcoleaceae cyanobacterium]